MFYELPLKDGTKMYKGYLVETRMDFNWAIRQIKEATYAYVDLETTGLYWYAGDKIAGVAVLVNDTAFYFPFRHASGHNLPISWMPILFNTLENMNALIGWNFKFDLNFLRNEGFDTLRAGLKAKDVMVALHLLDENRYSKGLNYKLKDNAAIFIDADAAHSDKLLQEELAAVGLKKGSMCQLAADSVAVYAMYDVILTAELYEFFIPYLEKWGQAKLFGELCDFEQLVLHRMEATGMLVDRDLIEQRITAAEHDAQEALEKIQQAAGYAINPNSPAQVASWLGLSDAQRETLELSGDPRAEMIIDYKFLAKAVNTFYQPYLHFSRGDGRIHPSLNIIGTVSGRLSSSEPNLQQVPRKAKQGKKGYAVKDVFVAPPGYVLAQFDYGQLELRLACHFSQEPTMTQMFNDGTDLHQYTADALGIDRQTGKTMNFGLLYGMGPEKAAAFLRLDLADARRLVPAWHALYPSFRAAHDAAIKTAQKWRLPDGTECNDWTEETFQFIRLPDGRVRHYEGDNARYFSSWNTLVQGTGAIVMREALLRITFAYPPEDDAVIPVMTVHDSMIAYIREDEVEQHAARICELMTDFPYFNPSLTVDVKWGKSWGDV